MDEVVVERGCGCSTKDGEVEEGWVEVEGGEVPGAGNRSGPEGEEGGWGCGGGDEGGIAGVEDEFGGVRVIFGEDGPGNSFVGHGDMCGGW